MLRWVRATAACGSCCALDEPTYAVKVVGYRGYRGGNFVSVDGVTAAEGGLTDVRSNFHVRGFGLLADRVDLLGGEAH